MYDVCRFVVDGLTLANSQDPLFQPDYYLSIAAYRELTLQRLKVVADMKLFSVVDYVEDPMKFQIALETLAWCDYSLSIKAGVHFSLCGGTIAKLGTEKHHRKYFRGIDKLTLPGCFGMTELGHGSNVMGIETTAVYDHAKEEFIIHTPSDEASKFWIGGAALHAKICTVFAQLTINGKEEGPHAFVVRLRDDFGHLSPGVRIEDNGPKMGLNGVDNGRIWFHHVRVPKDELLDAFATVDDNGHYHSKIKSVSQRFAVTVGALTAGRTIIAQSAADASKLGLIIAIRYSMKRPQFGSKPIMEYLTHRLRLIPCLAATVAWHLGLQHLKMTAVCNRPEDTKLLHVMSSGLKSAATWSRVETLQICRECCGGQGFLAKNRIGSYKTDCDVDVTFEGDNTVLMQQVAKFLLDQASSGKELPLPKRSPRDSDFLAQDHLLALFEYREWHLTRTIARDMKEQGQAGYDSNLDKVVRLGWAYTERICLELFSQKVNSADQRIRPVLTTLLKIYALSRIEKDLGTFVVLGTLGSKCAEGVREQLISHCNGLVDAQDGSILLQVCDAFGLPDHLLHAPIAFNWSKL